MAYGRSFDFGAIEEALASLPDLELLGLMPHSSNYTFLVRLGPDPDLLAIYKPAAGERPLWDFPPGTLFRREVAAYALAKGLGWPCVPPTVVRAKAPHGIGSLQMFVDGGWDPDQLTHSHDRREWMEFAVFDVIANNADRKAGHCLTDSEGVIWAIDHGLTFHAQTKLRTVIWEFAGRRLPAPMRDDLARVAADLDGGELAMALSDLTDPDEVEALRRRVDRALDRKWSLPHPESDWSIPWPPI